MYICTHWIDSQCPACRHRHYLKSKLQVKIPAYIEEKEKRVRDRNDPMRQNIFQHFSSFVYIFSLSFSSISLILLHQFPYVVLYMYTFTCICTHYHPSFYLPTFNCHREIHSSLFCNAPDKGETRASNRRALSSVSIAKVIAASSQHTHTHTSSLSTYIILVVYIYIYIYTWCWLFLA